MPWAAYEEVSRSTADGTGQMTMGWDGTETGLQMWYIIDHDNVNRATPTEFGYFLDGTPATGKGPWASASEPSDAKKHYV